MTFVYVKIHESGLQYISIWFNFIYIIFCRHDYMFCKCRIKVFKLCKLDLLLVVELSVMLESFDSVDTSL